MKTTSSDAVKIQSTPVASFMVRGDYRVGSCPYITDHLRGGEAKV
jgi:hypothetical protein